MEGETFSSVLLGSRTEKRAKVLGKKKKVDGWSARPPKKRTSSKLQKRPGKGKGTMHVS